MQVLSREDDTQGVRCYLASLLNLGENGGEQLTVVVLQ